jgi:GDPmannose 4,6-dehydratase
MKAFITGITGMDGSYLSELLLDKGYEVHGLIRRTATTNTKNIDHIKDRLTLHYGDLSDMGGLYDIIEQIKPDEIYNLGAQSDVGISFKTPVYTFDITAGGVVRLLEAIRCINPAIRFYQASSSEIFGNAKESPQNENTPIKPRSPYGCAKAYGYCITRNYREAYQIHASNGILFNHESERRGDNFVTMKIAKGLKDTTTVLELGNLDSKRDWGYSPDYVKAMWLMLQQDKPDDYVIATGTTRTVREFVEVCIKILGRQIIWKGTGLDEIGLDPRSGQTIVKVNPKYYRPAEVELLLGDSTKAREHLGWEVTTPFETMVERMLNAN